MKIKTTRHSIVNSIFILILIFIMNIIACNCSLRKELPKNDNWHQDSVLGRLQKHDIQIRELNQLIDILVEQKENK